MPRVILGLLLVAATIYTAVAAIQTPEDQHRHLPKMVWLLLILGFPLVGCTAWWLVGRPAGGAPPFPRPSPRPRPSAPRGPDDDPDFLKKL